MQIDQSTQPQQQAPSTDVNNQTKSAQKVSEDEASKFNKELTKKDKPKKEKKNKSEKGVEEQSLASLFAEQRQARDALEPKNKDEHEGHQGEKSQDHLVEMAFSQINETQLKSNIQLTEIQQAKSVKEVEATLQKMADQIHVSGKDAVNGAEIRISIKDSILPGTEVRIQRHGGELTVTMNTSSAEAHNLLAQHQASLQKHLNDRFSNEQVQINFHMTDESGDQNDGRSKNEYVSEDNDDDNENKPA